MKSETKVKVRVGKICYTNAIPFYHNLESTGSCDLEFFEAVPAELNLAMHNEQIDMAPISSLEYLNHQSHYLLLPSFAIGARDFSGSVLLFSKEKIEGLNGVTIALSRHSLSSAALLKILLKFKYKFENTFVESVSNPEEMLKKNTAALVIGDDALFYQPKEFIYKYDLSELWWSWAEKPFCFALWAVRKKFASEFPQLVTQFCRHLQKNLERNLVHLETLIKDSLGLTFLDQKFSKVFGYLFNLGYVLDPEMKEGLELFYRLANQLEISPTPEPLEFFNLEKES